MSWSYDIIPLKYIFCRNPQFWILNIAYNLPNGAFNSWIPLVSVSFRGLNVDEVRTMSCCNVYPRQMPAQAIQISMSSIAPSIFHNIGLALLYLWYCGKIFNFHFQPLQKALFSSFHTVHGSPRAKAPAAAQATYLAWFLTSFAYTLVTLILAGKIIAHF